MFFDRSRLYLAIVTRVTVITLAAALASISAGSFVPAKAASSGLAYDELMKSVMSTSGAKPEPGMYANGSFAADFQAAVNTGGPPKVGSGFFNMIAHAQQYAQQAQNMIKNGNPSTHYFLNGWERTDDPLNQTATIYRGDLKQIIHLDLAKKTYTITQMGEVSGEAPAPPAQPQVQNAPQPSPQPGTAKMAITATTSGLGPKTIENQQTQGFTQTFKLAVTEATGSCKDGTFQTSMTEFVSQIPEPTLAMPSGKVIPRKSNYDPQHMSVTPGCKPTITANVKKGPTPPSGMLAMWQYMELGGGMGAPPAAQNPQSQQAQQAQPKGSLGFVIERGNVRTLGPNDKGLFEVPAGFTKVDTSSGS